ncbi:MAG TPA: hypothetical protein PLO59_09665, partial [Bacteroidia bacterium]|nr:hypothetical protein [Bacteroidia bacterium]
MKTFVKGFVWVTGILLLLLVLVTSIAYWQKDKLINYVLGDINQQLQSKINIASIDFNVIKHFPNTSLVLNKVYAAPAKPFLQSDTLLAADKIYLLFDILQLINGKYQLKKVVIESAIIKLQIEKRGLRNFDIWKSDNAPAKSNLNLQFKEVLLKQTAFVFDDFKQTTHYNAYFNNAQLQGNFSEKQFEVKAKANLWLHQLQVAGIHLNQSRQAMLDCNIKVNRNQNEITFLPSQIKIEGIDLGIAGKLKFLNDTTQYGLTLNGNQIDLIALASVWPVVAKTTNQYSASGLVSFKATINGYQTIKTKPKIEAHFSADNAALKASNDAQLTHISFNGFYSNSYNGVDLLTLNKVSCQLNAQPLTGAFTVSNFKT